MKKVANECLLYLFLMGGGDEGEGYAIFDFWPPPSLDAPDMEGSIENS